MAELEVELDQLRKDAPTKEARDTSYEHLSLATTLAAATLNVVSPGLPHSTSWPIFSAFHLSPSNLPMPLKRQPLALRTAPEQFDDSDTPIDSSRPAKLMRLSDVPRNAADFMIKTYTEYHLPQYPCISETTLSKSYETCYESANDAASFDRFITYMALAISAKTLAWKSEKYAFSTSNGFWNLAKEELKDPSCNYTPVNRLQVALLLAHYALTNPSAANMWYCVGDAARLCIQFGYHREPAPGVNVDLVELENRRRLFWTTYGLERALSSYLRLPFLINEDVITTQYPSVLPDSCIRPDGLFPGPQKKASALHMWQYRRLETEVFRVLFLQEDIFPSMTLEEWMDDVLVRVTNWHRKATTDFAPEDKIESRDVHLNFLKGRLHRPTPRNPFPSHASRLQCIDAALQISQDYRSQKRRGRLYYPWFAVHILFEAAVVMLDTAWSCLDWLSTELDLGPVISGIRSFPPVLMDVAVLWPAAGQCANAIETLSKPVLDRLETVAAGLDPGPLDEEVASTLADYLFPDPDFKPSVASNDMDLPVYFGQDDELETDMDFDWNVYRDLESLIQPYAFEFDESGF
ncbi:hypothetical protein LTR10_018865 [Elasticomyces elasticus]|uniref:Xylanolytic transcriptional activator regulatory domain-containing protein n=1 Tax=Exophiala sideris TaxID=1016849 RepID=A0ABR0IW30_9EURO|nr:hypothetical protein LTR10_018865 [Elasticomyces elasticus]KAK5021664.1 hypothetical protein LTS07_010835 [Exophiala sideris]KAK5049802.1 hypothetical protein LTR69_010859 [Exophiala sideris]KAK5176783.1 hypothetical protein LTR44_010726 [Eurotiomycetes sp. CCFEE 6388]